MSLRESLAKQGPWTAPPLPESIPHGDMPGDKIVIGEDHVRKAQLLFPKLLEALKGLDSEKAVVSVFGGSGVGKSEIAALLGWYFREAGVGSYVLSGDNYPRRIPVYNDAERLRIFRSEGLKGLLRAGEIIARTAEKLLEKPELIQEARAELEKRLDGGKYKCLIPDEVKPHYYD